MWKPLYSSQSVHPGDKIRYIGNSSFVSSETLYEVTRAEQYYFEMAPDPARAETPQSRNGRRIVRYFDIGHYVVLEIWSE